MSIDYYSGNGVKIRPANPLYQDTVEIAYDGLLANSGAAEIYAHVGFDEDWKAVQDYRMGKTAAGFETSVFLPADTDSLNICFRDSSGNWDNNSGANYIFDVEAKHSRSAAFYSFVTEAGEDLTALLSRDFTDSELPKSKEEKPKKEGLAGIPSDRLVVSESPAAEVNTIGNFETVSDEIADRDK